MTNLTDPTATLGLIAQRTEAAIDEQQMQIEALEQLVLNRAALVDVRQDGRKVHFLFTRRGAVRQITCYADMSVDVAAIRRDLLE